jgi:hypothetical protein
MVISSFRSEADHRKSRVRFEWRIPLDFSHAGWRYRASSFGGRGVLTLKGAAQLQFVIPRCAMHI